MRYNFYLLSLITVLFSTLSVDLFSQCGPTEVGGTVYREYKFDGTQNPAVIDEQYIPKTRNLTGSVETRPAEMPFGGGVVVNIYDDSGFIGTTTTAVDGTWTFDVSGANSSMVRIEYTIPTGFESGPNGSENRSSVLFSAPGNCDNDFTIANRCDHCQDDPSIAGICFSRNNDGNGEPVLIDMKYNTGIPFIPRKSIDQDRLWATPQGVYPVATDLQVGGNKGELATVFGIDWSRIHSTLYVGSYYRSYAPLTTNGSSNGFGEGVISAVEYADNCNPSSSPSVWLDLETLLGDGIAGAYQNDPPFPGANQFGTTGAFPNLVGYVGLGSVKISPKGDELYTVNLATREVYILFLLVQMAQLQLIQEILLRLCYLMSV